jgi:glycosyltransferase involved in cell wall biosynthesis
MLRVPSYALCYLKQMFMLNQNIPTKKILYLITQSELGGAQKYVFDLAKGLRHDFEISVAFGEQGEKGELAGLLQAENIPYHAIPNLKREISPASDIRAVFEIARLIRKIKPDIIHLNSSKVSILGSIAYFFQCNFHFNSTFDIRHSTFLYTAHGWVFNEPMGSLKRFFYKYAEKLTAGIKDAIICVSEFDRQAAIRERIAPEKKLITIHNGLTPVDFISRDNAFHYLENKILKSKIENPPQREANLPPSLRGANSQIINGGRKSKILIASIGNLYKTKGYEYAIEAMRSLASDNQLSSIKNKMTYIIFGEGPERPKLEALIKKSGLEDQVILAGRVPEASRLLKAFDLYLCPSVKEGLSYTLIEAMQAGLPIVATSAGGNPELIKDGTSGLIAEPADPETLADKISWLFNHQEKRVMFSKNASESALADFALNRMIEKTKKIYG